MSAGQPTAKTIARAKGWKSTHTYKVSPCESFLALLSKFKQDGVSTGELVNIPCRCHPGFGGGESFEYVFTGKKI